MTRSPEHNQKIRDERRESILRHALKLFATKGLYATKVSDIAAEVGMSQGLLYHYFASKDDIFTELIRDAFMKMNSAALGLEELSLSPKEKIELAMRELLRSIEESEEFAPTVLLIAQAGVSDNTPAEAREVLREQSGIAYDVVERIIRAGQRDGSIRQHDAQELSMVFWTLIKGLALHKAVYRETFKAPDASVLASMFLRDKENRNG